MKLKNGVRIRDEYRQGYGGPDTWYVYVEWDNRLLLEQSTTSERELGSLLEKLRKRYGVLSAKELRTRAESAPLAHPICERCGKPCESGTVSKGVTRAVSGDRTRSGKASNPTWCAKCDKEEPGVIGTVFREGSRVVVKASIAIRPELRDARRGNSDIRIPGATGSVLGMTGQFGCETYVVRYEAPISSVGHFTEDELQAIPEIHDD